MCVTGATGFIGGHVTRSLLERGHRVRVTFRDRERLARLRTLEVEPAAADILDLGAMTRAAAGARVLFHVAGYVGSRDQERAWRVNALAPRVAVEAAAAAGVPRVVLTSTSASIGAAERGRPVDERHLYRIGGHGLTYCNTKHEGEAEALAAGMRLGVEVVVLNPSYVLGVPVADERPGETSTRAIGNYLCGRLPGFFDGTLSAVDVRDVAEGHLLAAERGRPGERYLLGGHNLTWRDLYARVAELSGSHYPLMVFPAELGLLARAADAVGIRAYNKEGPALMALDWRCTSERAERELGYTVRPLEETLRETIAWYSRLIEGGTLARARRTPNWAMARAVQLAARLGGLRLARAIERVTRRQSLFVP
jgi:dihydroflavonol-4-reductase